MPTQPIDIEKIVFWGCTLLIVQNFRVILKLIQMNPKKIYERIDVIMPRSGRTIKDIFHSDQNQAKFKLVLWHLKIRDIFGILSLFSGIFMIGGYATYLLQLFAVDKPQVVIVVCVNAFVLFVYTLQKIKCQRECVAFDRPDLAADIKAGHY